MDRKGARAVFFPPRLDLTTIDRFIIHSWNHGHGCIGSRSCTSPPNCDNDDPHPHVSKPEKGIIGAAYVDGITDQSCILH